MRHLVLLLLAASPLACDDHLFPARHGDDPEDAEGWCAVEALIAGRCLACHGAAALGGLRLDEDPAGALIGVASSGYPEIALIDPGSPTTSLFFLKITGAQGDRGGVMPPTGAVDAELAARIEAWIAEGADPVCADEPPTPVDRHHPPGFFDPTVHAPEAKFQVQPCLDCHGADLEGDVGPACSSCHGDGWKADCRWCHGTDPTGLPPEDIDDETDPTRISFPPHGVHVAGRITDAFDCFECHLKPTDALSPGHLFVGDTTPGVAEVRFDLGRFDAGTYAGRACTTYCHSNGRGGAGQVAVDAGPRGCLDCHGGLPAGAGLSRPHDDHLDEGVGCEECHGATVSAASAIVGRGLHVNGTPDVELPAGMARTGGLCTGSCHGEAHNGRSWTD